MKKILLIISILAILLVSCSAPEEKMADDVGEMPCHQMPDGTWMGDCDDAGEMPEEIAETADEESEALGEDLDNMGSELDLSDLEDVDAELADFDW